MKLQMPSVATHVVTLSSLQASYPLPQQPFRDHLLHLSVHVWSTKTPRGEGRGPEGPHVQTEAGPGGGASQGQSGGLEPHLCRSLRRPPQEVPTAAASGIWPAAQTEVSLSEAGLHSARFVFPATPPHPYLHDTWAFELWHTFEKGKSGSGRHHPSEVSKDFPFPKPFPLNLAKTFLPG